MDEKPEALRLADVPICERSITWQSQATAELRRLHEENQEQLKTLRDCVLVMELGEQAAAELLRLHAVNGELLEALRSIAAIENQEWGADWEEIDEAREIAENAIAKAQGKT